MTRPVWLFVGSYAPADRPGIHLVTVDETSGTLEHRGAVAGVANPSYLALHPDGDRLYAVSETGRAGDGAPGAVHAFRIEYGAEVPELIPLNRHPTGGDHPCHLALDPSGRWLAAANYSSGSVAVFPLGADGAPGEAAAVQRHEGRGPHPTRQQAPHAHATVFAPDGRWLLAADLGIDRIVVYAFDAATGTLVPHGAQPAAPGAGPRLLAFHPDGLHLFAVNELDSTLSRYRWDGATGRLTDEHRLSTLRRPAPGNTAADLQVAPSGDRVYVSNRGDDSVAVYAFDPAGGLSLETVRPTGGPRPRSIALTPGGGHLVAANRSAGEVVLIPLRAGGRDLGEPLARIPVPEPSCVMFGPPGSR